MTVAVSWRVDSVARATPAASSLGSRPLDHPEWVRLLMGDFLAPARLTAEGQSWRADYLVTAREVAASTPESVRAATRQSVADDFECLLGTLRDHRERIARVRDGAPGEFNPTLFLDAYELLMAVTVSDDPAHWLLAEDGLCVVRWGLEGPGLRPLLTWTDAEVLAMRRSLEARAGALPSASAPSLRSKVLEELSKAATAPSAGAGARLVGPAAGRTSAARMPAPAGRVAPPARSRALQWALACLSVLLVVWLVWSKAASTAKAPSTAEIDSLKRDLADWQERLARTESDLREAREKLTETESALQKSESDLKNEKNELEAARNEQRDTSASTGGDQKLLDAIVVKLLPDRDHKGLITPKSALGDHVKELLEDQRMLRDLHEVFSNGGRGSGSVKELIFGGEKLQPLIDFLRDREKMGLAEGDLDSFVRGVKSDLLTKADQQVLWGEVLPVMEPLKVLADDPWKWRIAQLKGTDGAASWYLTESDSMPPPPGGSWAEGIPRKAPWERMFKEWPTLADQRCPAEVAAYLQLRSIQSLLDAKGDGNAVFPDALREFLARDMLNSMGKQGFKPQVDRKAKLKEAFQKPYDGKARLRLLTEAEAPGLAEVRELVSKELKRSEEALKGRQQTAGQVCSVRVFAVARAGRIRDTLSQKPEPVDFGDWEVRACDPEKGWSQWKPVGIVKNISVGVSFPGTGPDRVFLVAMKPIAKTPQGASK